MTSSFDERAATWDDDPAKVERARVVADGIRGAVPLGGGTRLLEYGAGTGLLSEALRDDVGAITVADTSAGMLDVLRSKVAAGQLPDARVWELDLSRDPVPDEHFDLVASVMVLHHIPDLAPVLRGFARMLDDGGHLCIADLDREDGSFHGPGFDGHHGFDRAELTAQLEEAGFGGVRFEPCGQVARDDRAYAVFLATCARDGGRGDR